MIDTGPPRVVMFPDATEHNPYQRLLLEHLDERGVDASAEPPSVWFPLLRGWLETDRPEVIHLHWITPFIGSRWRWVSVLLGARVILELLLLTLFGTKLVWTVHNLEEHERRHPRVDKAIRTTVAHLSDHLIIHCDEMRVQVSDALGLSGPATDKVVVIPHGHYLDAYPNEITRQTSREMLDLDMDETVFLYFGMIRPYKQVPHLIETFRSIEAPTARLVVAGSPWSGAIESTVERAANDDDRVTTELSFIPDEQVQHYLASADVVVLPFSSILTSGSAILAMSFGRAVILPDIGCPASLIEPDGGFTYDPGEDDGLAQAIRTALDSTDALDSIGRRNKRVAERLNWAGIAAATIDVYLGESTEYSIVENVSDHLTSTCDEGVTRTR